MREEGAFTDKTLKGIGVSSGITSGRVYLLERGRVAFVKRKIREETIDKEVVKFKYAINSAIDELNAIKIAVTDDEIRKHAFIIDAHMLILQDTLFHDEVIDTIRAEKINAEWALDIVVSRFLSGFEKVDDPYLRERGQDIKFIYNRLIRIMIKGKESAIEMQGIRGKVIIVAHDLSPADTIQLNLNRISGFTTDVGGRTSHTSIVARALEIPAVVGAGNITSLVKNNDNIIIDGDNGIVIINPSRKVQKDYIVKQLHLKAQKKEFLKIARLRAETRDGFRLKVGANIELLAEMDLIKRYGAVGIGLYRTEYLYLSRKTLPTETDHYHVYRKLAENKSLQYVTVRTLDIGGDKFASQIEVPREINPAMGLRAIRLCVREIGLFKAQLMGILRASAYGPLRILIPMISGIDEVRKAKEIVDECKEELRHNKIEFNNNIKVGVMIEVPSACMISDILAKEVDFFSIGTNDLIQYSLAIDRINEYVSYLYEPLHPAVLRLIKQTVDNAHANKIEVGLCGEMAGEPLYAPILIGMGIDELSMNAYAIPRVKKVIRGISQDYCKELLNELMIKNSAKEGEYILKKEMGRLFPNDFSQEHDE
ncbi:MAG TPA: phosphoenolpyruvate--protein phosphotransferase [Syntrophorhabdus sp.]|jgi:phosphotransferase system enzyme I (PtsI)|nr:phosphoenolpyruvate--protein phosphotransferase [Syntrophorhabdus sp.]MDI9558551.1 phosphoenolpyruvate--protein phosphotransferase [Pseudomonadota bacterium]OQB77608.1 MAG: Phosphoenolpyruvate-protein phosphotransferase [Deltaproteobacteria bacterium ADurb.Bin135]HNQ45567.1 phosphoenolpyruvate--protein phosphotransferase [Syntrophorhabdus sp.]HNS77260.1 phosphoenolpyruvate--protein phosphotransferase [Syntrophorhabdus sp.]